MMARRGKGKERSEGITGKEGNASKIRDERGTVKGEGEWRKERKKG